jgi:hypothetical protein
MRSLRPRDVMSLTHLLQCDSLNVQFPLSRTVLLCMDLHCSSRQTSMFAKRRKEARIPFVSIGFRNEN